MCKQCSASMSLHLLCSALLLPLLRNFCNNYVTFNCDAPYVGMYQRCLSYGLLQILLHAYIHTGIAFKYSIAKL